MIKYNYAQSFIKVKKAYAGETLTDFFYFGNREINNTDSTDIDFSTREYRGKRTKQGTEYIFYRENTNRFGNWLSNQNLSLLDSTMLKDIFSRIPLQDSIKIRFLYKELSLLEKRIVFGNHFPNFLTYSDPLKNKELYFKEKQFVENYILFDSLITPNEYDIIIHYGLFDKYKDTLKKHLKQLERSYYKREENPNNKWIEPLHILLAQNGDTSVEDLIYKRIEDEIMSLKMSRYDSERSQIYSKNLFFVNICLKIRTPKSYEKLKILLEEELKNSENYLLRAVTPPPRAPMPNGIVGCVVVLPLDNPYMSDYTELYNYKRENKDSIYNYYLNFYKQKYPIAINHLEDEYSITKLAVIIDNLTAILNDKNYFNKVKR